MATEELDKSAVKKIEGDEFYERIEAPKFVDFTVPDHYRPDDRYWFCLRVGCDQKHEEEMDSEAIYKDFVLRVMAARSPNIKIRKMLNRKTSSTLKCPLTAPAKPSKSRISRLAVLSSISRKLDVTKDKAKPPQKLITATPKGSTKQPSSITKAFTTPRNRKRVSNQDKFSSVRNPKPITSVAGTETTKVVAKALVFRSPKKTFRIKTSLEMKTPVTKLCAAMSKLEIESGKKQKLGCNNKAMPLEKTARRPLRGREVKSRVYDSLLSHTNKGKGKLPLKSVKKKKMEKGFEPSCDTVKDNDSSDMEIDERSRHGTLEGCSVSVSSENDKTNGHEVSENNGLEDKATDRSKPEEKVEIIEGTNSPKVMNNLPCDDKEEKVKLSEGTNSPKNIDEDDKENALPSNETENDSEAIEYDDKENASASNDNREPNVRYEAEILTNHDREKANQVTKKPLKKSSIVTPSLQEAKYKKPKPTNPKPFRLRTDERGILKEATLERKLVTPLKEITSSIKPSVSKSLRKNQNSSQKNENCQGQSENENVTCEDGKNCTDKAAMEQPRRAKIKTMRAKKCPVSTKEHARVEGVTSSNRILERTKSSTKTPQGIGSSRRTVRLGGVKEVAKPSENGASSSVPRSISRGRRATTIPKEPNFHPIHIPKSCTRKIAA